MRLELVYFAGCPNVPDARAAIAEVAPGVEVVEIDTSRGNARPAYQGWPSPTILVDGTDVMGGHPEDSEATCAIYSAGALRARLRTVLYGR